MADPSVPRRRFHFACFRPAVIDCWIDCETEEEALGLLRANHWDRRSDEYSFSHVEDLSPVVELVP